MSFLKVQMEEFPWESAELSFGRHFDAWGRGVGGYAGVMCRCLSMLGHGGPTV